MKSKTSKVRFAEFAKRADTRGGGAKPSRLDSAFACPTLAAAEQYRAKHAPTGLIYRIELLNINAPSHVGDYELYLQGIRWNRWYGGSGAPILAGSNSGTPELLTLSPLRVIECVAGDSRFRASAIGGDWAYFAECLKLLDTAFLFSATFLGRLSGATSGHRLSDCRPWLCHPW